MSTFAAICFSMAVILLILSFWNNWRTRKAIEDAKKQSILDRINKAKSQALAISRGNSFTEKYSVLNDPSRESSGLRTPSGVRTPLLGRGIFSQSSMDLLHQKLSELPSAAYVEARVSRNNSTIIEESEQDMDESNHGAVKVYCKINITPFVSVPNSVVNSAAGSPSHFRSRNDSPVLVNAKPEESSYGSVSEQVYTFDIKH